MPVQFALAAADLGWPPLIEPIILGLVDRYPQAALRRVAIVDAPKGDRSMASTEGGVISLNAFWFGQEPQALQTAALMPPGWHGAMTAEPAHVATHEFGHVLSDALVGDWKSQIEAYRIAATCDADLSPSHYALGDADEFFAELFAVVELGFATSAQKRALWSVLRASDLV